MKNATDRENRLENKKILKIENLHRPVQKAFCYSAVQANELVRSRFESLSHTLRPNQLVSNVKALGA